VVPPKDRFAAIAKMAEEGHPAQTCCRVLEVTDSGYYAWRSRPPSARSVRHAWLTDLITGSTWSPAGPTARFGSTRSSRWAEESSRGTTLSRC
jgi:hypothetical protein